MVAKSGDRLLDRDAETAYRERMLPLATVRHPEPAGGGSAPRPSGPHPRRDARGRACVTGEGPRAVVVKGGHLEGDAVDVFWDGERLEDLPAPRIETRNTHGTGCTYSAAIAARLALGEPLLDAVRGAKAYLTEAIRRSYSVGRGHGPVDHLHPLTSGGRRG